MVGGSVQVDAADAPGDSPLDLLVIGDLNPDLVLRGDVVPRFGQAEQLLSEATTVLAGSGGIVAAGAALLGLRTAIAAHVGQDAFGDMVIEWLWERGVECQFVTRTEADATGISVILSGGDDRSILTFPGAMTLEDGSRATREVLARTRHVHLAGYFLLPRLRASAIELFARAHDAGCTTSLDTNWDPSERWEGIQELLAVTDVFLPNTAELLAISGCSDVEGAATSLRAQAPELTLVLKQGPDGASAWGPDDLRTTLAAIPVDAVDTTGAGDSFDAGFLAAWLAGQPLSTCVSWGCLAGGLSTRGVGGTGAQARRDEIEKYLA